jgi:beta-galactosidase/beta-glucuronidase
LPDFDDSNFTVVDAPHDMIINGTYDENDPASGSSYLPRLDGIYRKHFNLPTDWKGSSVWLQFDGVFHTTKIYLNGQGIGSHQCGYTSFNLRLDNSSEIKYGVGKANENVLAMFVDGSKGSGWWYEGA